MEEEVELHAAHTWDCPDCGRENFCRGVVKEFSKEEEEDLKEEFDIGYNETGIWMTAPDEVTCKFCNRTFSVKVDADEDNSDLDWMEE